MKASRSLRRIAAIALRDLASASRNFFGLFIVAMPFVLAFLLSLLIPGVSASLVSLVVVEDADPAFVSFLGDHATIERARDTRALEARVGEADEIIGVEIGDSGPAIVAQGDEDRGRVALVSSILRSWNDRDESPAPEIEFEDAGRRVSPLKLEGGAFLAVFCTVFGGMLIALSMVEEKMSNTLSAMNVSPVSRAEFVAGKALLGFLAPAIGVAGILAILGFTEIDYGMAAVTALAVACVSVIIGFAVGISASDPISAIAGMKIVFLPVFLSVIGGALLEEKWHFLLYWSPHYWAYRTVKSLLLAEATWGTTLIGAGAILALTAVVFILLRKRIARGLR